MSPVELLAAIVASVAQARGEHDLDTADPRPSGPTSREDADGLRAEDRADQCEPFDPRAADMQADREFWGNHA